MWTVMMKLLYVEVTFCPEVKSQTSFSSHRDADTEVSMLRFPNSLHFRGLRRFPLFNGDLFTQEIPNEIILIWMDYDVVLRLEEMKSKSISSIITTSQGFGRNSNEHRRKFIGFNLTLSYLLLIKNLKNSICANLSANRKPLILFILSQSKVGMYIYFNFSWCLATHLKCKYR